MGIKSLGSTGSERRGSRPSLNVYSFSKANRFFLSDDLADHPQDVVAAKAAALTRSVLARAGLSWSG
jgi:hypothetical protein